MKNQTIYLILFVFITLITSCSNDDDSTENNIIDSSCDFVTSGYVCGENLLTFDGTVCCITGPELVSPG